MARMRSLLHYARLSRQRSMSLKRSGMAKGIELCIVALLLFAYYKQLKLMMTGPPSSRLPASELVILVLAMLWLLLPIGTIPSIPASLLTVYPLSQTQRVGYRLLSHWLDWKVTALFAASVVGIVAIALTPRPLMRIAQAICVLAAACTGGTALALGTAALQNRSLCSTQNTKARRIRRFPLFYKEITYFSRTLDPYLALLIAVAAGYTETIAAWMTPAKATLPLLLLSVIQLPSVLNPFALNTRSEIDRYRLMPFSFARILANKHASSAALFLLSALPLVGALLFRLTWRQSIFTIAQLALILVSFLLTGLVLMHTLSAQNIKMRVGGLAGEGLTLGLFSVAAIMNAFFPLAVLFCTRGSWLVLQAAAFGAPIVLGLFYAWLLRRQTWLSHL
jgi:hypothetical protein